MTPQEYLKRPYARLVVPEDDGSFRAEIAEFPGCIALGDTEVAALTELKDVAEGWLASVIARGQPVPEPMEEVEYSGKFVVRLSKSLHRKATYAARRDGVSLNQFIVNAVSETVGIRTAITNVFHTAVYHVGRLPIQVLRSDTNMPWQHINRITVENSFSTGSLVSVAGGKNA